jgi:ATP-binding cassette, subfamily B, bacterial PglK
LVRTIKQALHLMAYDHRGRWVLLVILALVASGFEMVGAILVYVLLALVIDPSGSVELPVLGDLQALFAGRDEQTVLIGLAIAMGVFFALRAVVQISVTYVQQRVAHNAGARLSNRIVEGYLRLPYAMHLQRSTAELIRNGHQAVREMVVHVFIPLIRVAAETALTIGMIIVLVAIAPAATALAVAVVGGAALLVLLAVQSRLRFHGRVVHDASQTTLATVQESLQGVRDIKVLGREREFGRKYAGERLRLSRASYIASTLTDVPRAVIETALIAFILIFFLVALLLGEGAQAALSVLGLFAYTGLRLQPSLQRIIGGLNELKYSAAPLRDVEADLKLVEGLSDQSRSAREPIGFERSLRLDGVSFRYEGADRDAVAGVDLEIKPGEQIGICGPTGGGKSTLVDLIIGLLEPTSGAVTVDGRALPDVIRGWQASLGVVPQMVFLIDDSLRRNIALGVPDDQVDEVALTEAIEQAQLNEFVASLPDGLATIVGERGVRISGGQRQRIAIARALYHEPAVLIMDEGTSALDTTTESMLMRAVEELRGSRTVILVAHRLSTVRGCDRVLYVEDGQVSGGGDFAELERSTPRFRSMVAGDARGGDV